MHLKQNKNRYGYRYALRIIVLTLIIALQYTTPLYSQDPAEKVQIYLPVIVKGKIDNAPQDNLTSFDCDGGDGVYLYEKPNYEGECRRFTKDQPNFADSTVSFLNKASSIRFVGSFDGEDYQVLLCEQANYEGVCIAFRMDNPDVNANGSEINGVQSLIIEHVSPSEGNQTSFDCDGGDGVYLYEHPGYNGACRKFTADHPNFADSQVSFLNKASSIQFKGSYGNGSYRALVCARPSYKGVCSPFRVDDNDFGTNSIGHDNAQSIIVEPTDAFGESLRIGTYNIQYQPWTPDLKTGWDYFKTTLEETGSLGAATIGGVLEWMGMKSVTGDNCCEDIAGRDWKLAERIIEGEYDIIAFNEAFAYIQEPMKKYLKSLYPYGIYEVDFGLNIAGSEAMDFAVKIDHQIATEPREYYYIPIAHINSGLMMASRFPIEPLAVNPYSYYSCNTQGPINFQDFAYSLYRNCQGDDCLADKGVVYTRIKNPVTGRFHNILVTHLDGDRPTGLLQLEQVKDVISATMVNKELENEPVIIMGDLNFSGEYLDPTISLTSTDRSEWETIFEENDFFSDKMTDTWEAQQGNLQPDDPDRAHGYTVPVTYNLGDLPGRRYDYIIRNRRQTPELCVQHVSVAYNMRHGAPYYEGAFGSVGYQDLSDHYGLNADLNLMAPHCSPQQAYPVTLPLTPTVAVTIPATISNPGNMQWYWVDQPGTYSINLVGKAFLDFQVYKSAHLSAPLARYYSDAKNPYNKLFDSIGEEYTYHIDDGPFYIRVFSKKRSWTGPYELQIRKHAGFNMDDAILLLPGQALTTTFPVSGGVTSTEQWFQIITEEPYDSNLDQTLHFEAAYQPTGSPSFKIFSEDEMTPEESESGAITINENTNDRKFYMVVRGEATDPDQITVKWTTNLIVMHETPEHPLKLYAEKQTEKDWFGDDDEIKVRISADGKQVVGPPEEYDFDTGQLRGLGDIIPEPIRFVNKLQIELEEQDSFLKGGDDDLAADDIGPSSDLIDDKPHWVAVPERGSAPTGFYRFHLNLGRHSYGTPEGLASNPGPAIFAGSEDKNGDGIDDFVLYVGELASQRSVEPDTQDERITVWQLNEDGTQFLVSGFGRRQIYPEGDERLQKGAILWADAGIGNDIIQLKPLQIDDNNIISFTVDSVIIAGEGHDMIRTGEGNDEIYGGKGLDILHGGGGHDLIYGESEPDFIFGGEGPDDLIGGPGKDLIYGEGGGDIILGDGGEIDPHDIIHDQPIEAIALLVSPTNDPSEGTLDCDDPVSIITEEGNADCLYGGDGNDIIFGEGGHDTLLGEAGNDYLTGNNGEDSVQGDDGNDIIYGETGDDTLAGGNDNDLMYGNEGNDLLQGGPGHDDIIGGNGSDALTGDTGEDYMIGDGGAINRDDTANPVTLESTGGGGVITSCLRTVAVVTGRLDLNDDGNVNDSDDGFFEGYLVIDGRIDLNRDDIVDDTDNGVVLNWPLLGGEFDVNNSGGIDDDDTATLAGVAIIGSGSADCIFGDAGNDRLYGGTGGDNMFGLSGVDYMEGNEDNDLMRGGIGADRMLGGSSATGTGDAGDEMYGDAGIDLMLGDNGLISEDGQLIKTIDPQIGGEDTIEGNEDPDIVLGGASGDDIWGHTGADIILGDNGLIIRNEADIVEQIESTYPDQGGADTIQGNEDPDIILGGTDGDWLAGNEHDDTILGDSGRFDYRANDDDLATLDIVTSISPTSGGMDTISGGIGADLVFGGALSDTISGDEGHDILLGDHGLFDDSLPLNQNFLAIFTGAEDGGAGDSIHGNDDDDFILGQQGIDHLYGDAGQDDLTGGHNVPGGADDEDMMYGESDESPGTPDGSGADVMIGDNGLISRLLTTTGAWQVNPFNQSYARSVQLYDVELVGAPEIKPGVYGDDKMWGGSNDDSMYGQGGEDIIHGGAGDDTMEGNHGPDQMFGEEDEDDMIGGSSSGPDGLVGAGVPPTHLLDANDVMRGGADDDVMLGDNGLIERQVDGNGIWLRHTGYGFDIVVRETTMSQTPEQAGAYGDDDMHGDAGHDDLYGQLGDDYMEGNDGEDTLVGDLGRITGRVEDGSREQVISVPGPFFEETIYQAGTFSRLVELYAFVEGDGGEGNDTVLGGDGHDSMHGGPGNDIMNGNNDQDRLFGGDGEDVLWGGPDHDHLWGGYQDDYLDVRPRPADPAEWFTYGEPDNYQGLDIIYGGWHRDALQADVAAPGPQEADRLIDWAGGYNVFYVCPAAYGEGTITRQGSLHLRQFLQDLAEADGALSAVTEGSSGFRELAYVFPNERGQNSHPPHPDHPGHFTCDEPNGSEIADDGQNGADPTPANNQATDVTPVNFVPAAEDDRFLAAEDSIDNELDVLANDVDLGGQPLTITMVSTATHGTVIHNGVQLLYTPAADFHGTDHFTYTVSDGILTATAVVTAVIEPVNDPPVAVDDNITVVMDSASNQLDVTDNDIDPDGDMLTITLVGTANHGTATHTPISLLYAPPANFTGADYLTYTVFDGLLSDTGSITITVTKPGGNIYLPLILRQ